MAYEGLRLARDILYRAFAVGLALTVLFALITFYWRDAWTVQALLFFPVLDSKTLWTIVITWFAWLRFFLFFCLLVPALAIHWTLKRLEPKVQA